MSYMTSVQSSGGSGLAETLALLQGLQSQGRLPRAATGALAPDVRAWIADPGQSVAASIDAMEGADATRGALAGLESSELVVTASVSTEGVRWAEFTRRDVGDPETGIVGLASNSDGRVHRLVLLRAALVPPSALGKSSSAPPGRPILEGYFDDLMSSRFRE